MVHYLKYIKYFGWNKVIESRNYRPRKLWPRENRPDNIVVGKNGQMLGKNGQGNIGQEKNGQGKKGQGKNGQ